MTSDTVGSLLADIANAISDGLRVLAFSNKSQWGPDEHEQRRRLDEALDEAKKDFQELSPLVHGQRYYMNDRRPESLSELRVLKADFQFHADNFRDWARHGGHINPTWAVETTNLRNALHRAQCRAASRIFASERESSAPRCLGAFLVYRKQRVWAERLARRTREQAEAFARTQEGGGEGGEGEAHAGNNGQGKNLGNGDGDGDGDGNDRSGQQTPRSSRPGSRRGSKTPSLPPTPTQPYRHKRQGSSLVPSDDVAADDAADDEYEMQRQHLEELALCNSVGKFERFGDRDIAFVCDFCDGYIVWEDIESMPSIRTVDEETLAAAAVEETVTSPGAGGGPNPSPASGLGAGPEVGIRAAAVAGGVEGVGVGGVAPGAGAGYPPPAPSPAPAAPAVAATVTATPRIMPPPPPPETPGITHWQATGFSVSAHKEKSVVFAPLAIANHVAPGRGEWTARLRCAACDEPPPDWAPPEGGDDDGDGADWPVDDELAFDDLEGLREHLEWQHTASVLPAASASCAVM